MSTRFYPRFVRGNPQLRIFLPDWKMIMIKTKNKDAMPNNIVTFKVDPRMTDWDIKNYLEKIYKVQVGAINSEVRAGRLKTFAGQLTKEDDYRLAHVTLPKGQTFQWPDLFPDEKYKEKMSDYDMTMKELNKDRKLDPNVQDIPSWFG